MKKFVFFITSILIAIILNAQSGCDVIITSNFESQCVLTLEKGDPLKELDGLILACKDSEVEYYATSTDVITYNWTVTGANSYIIINNGAGVRVNWSNGNIGEVKVQVITQDGSACESIKHIVLIEKPQIQSSSIPNYRFENGIKVIEVCLGESVTFTNESITSNTDIVGHYWESIYGSASTENYTIENIMQETKVIHKIINNCGCEDEERYEIRILEGKKLELSCYGTVCEGAEGTLYLVPNPASSFVKVEGIEQKDISEILLIDIQGKNIQKVQNTNTMNIQNILKGTYIIRVICNDSEVYYLKMIKN